MPFQRLVGAHDTKEEKRFRTIIYLGVFIAYSLLNLVLHIFVTDYQQQFGFDPLSTRIAFTAFSTSITFLIYWKVLKAKYTLSLQFIFTVYTYYIIFLCYANSYHYRYIIELLITTFISCLFVKKRKHLRLYLATLGISFIVCTFLYNHYIISFHFIWNSLAMVFIVIGVALFFEYKILSDRVYSYKDNLFSAIFNQTNDSILLLNKNQFEIVALNNQALKLLDIEKASLITGKNIIDFLHLTGSAYNWQSLVHSLISENTPWLEVKIKSIKQPTEYWVRISTKEMQMEEMSYYLLTIVDVSELMNKEILLEQNKEMLLKIIDLLPHEIYLKDNEGKFLLANEALLTYHQIPKNSIERYSDFDLFPIEQATRFKFDEEKIIQTGKPLTIPEERYYKTDGTITRIIQINKIPFFLPQKNRTGILGINVDITERKKIEYSLEVNERKFRALIENSSDMIVLLNEQLRIQYISPSAIKILNYLEREALHATIASIVHPDDLLKYTHFIESIKSLQETNHYLADIRIRRSSGEYLYVELVGINLLNDDVINGIIINFHDVTTRKNTEIELLNTNFELDSFIYRASHDMKAPLRSLLGLIALMRQENGIHSSLLQYLTMMESSIWKLDDFLKDLTHFVRETRLEPKAEQINFDEVINESLNSLKFIENVSTIVIIKSIDAKIPFHSDLSRIRVIINNLLSNSFKYHKNIENESFIKITVLVSYEKAIIQIEDNGNGIEHKYQDKVFDMFYRASERSYGTGLGLYIVKTAVTKLNGEIDLLSEPKEKTIFTVELPNLFKQD